jgi:hydroxymethylglutaryl-CoA lyase
MSDLPSAVHLREVGPREGFQMEPPSIPTAEKIRLADALAATGLPEIEIVSFVSPKWVPQMADAEAVARGVRQVPGARFEGIWLNLNGLDRAAQLRDVLALRPMFVIPASNAFSQKNANRTVEQHLDELPRYAERYRALGFEALELAVSTAWGCNYAGAIAPDLVLHYLNEGFTRADAAGLGVQSIGLMDTMGWANPLAIRRLVGAVRERWPALPLWLHLHDTRGAGIANFVAALELGVSQFDTAVGGMGGCPFAAHKGAAGNVCTEDAVFLCDEMGIATGVDLDALIAAAELAEEIVGHPLPGKVKTGGNLAHYRARVAAT